MKPATVAREVHSSGELSSSKFGISEANQVHILTILRDTLYTNKILAVLREYSANAWDAHREVGKEDQPIKVVLPTELEASVVIRDFGPGMSEEEVYTIYTQYGASTKRTTNKAVGMLGIGSKSGFAYNDAFTITSWHGGWKRVYHAVLDESDIGKVMKLWEEELEDKTETGIEIKVPVNPSDVKEFHKEAKRLFRHFRPMPDINIPLTEPPSTWKTPHGYLRRLNEHRYEDDWVAVMGCVPYRLNLGLLSDQLEAEGLTSVVENLRGGLYFDIGDVNIVANREDLEYKQRTKDAIVGKFKAVVEALSVELDTILKDASLTPWQKRLAVREFHMSTGLPLVDKYKEWRSGGAGVALYKSEILKDKDGKQRQDKDGEWLTNGPKTLLLKKQDTAYGNSGQKEVLKPVTVVPVSDGVRLLIRDVTKPWRGYVFSGTDMVIAMNKGFGVASVEKELEELLAKANLTGITVVRMSDMDYVAFAERAPNPYEKKHCQTVFELTGTRDYTPLSANWEIVQRVPDPDDVFVVIHRFMPTNTGEGWFGTVTRDRGILKTLFKENMPTIYGLKTTAYKPIVAKDVVGTEYEEWILKTFQEALGQRPDVQDLLDALLWSELTTGDYGWRGGCTEEASYKYLQDNLDGRHRLVRLFAQRAKYASIIRKIGYRDPRRHALGQLAKRLPQRLGAADAALERIGKKYPLLRVGQTVGNEDGLAVFSDTECQAHWLQYVTLVDNFSNNSEY